MKIKLRVNKDVFNEILNGKRDFVKHGFSNNKKYTRLFEKTIDLITLFSKNDSIDVDFVEIKTKDIEKGKKEIIIKFKL